MSDYITPSAIKLQIKLKMADIPIKYQIPTQTFIKNSKNKYGDRYLYHKTVYINLLTDLIVTCKLHGDLTVKPRNHLRFKLTGCYECDLLASQLDFIERASKFHKNKYDYSKVKYIGQSDKVIIICPIEEHGEFLQRPHDHIYSSGCPDCGIQSRVATWTCTKDRFIEKCIEVHGNRYDYSKVNYINTTTKVIIICSMHGDFKKTPEAHLANKGCQQCVLVERSLNYRKTPDQFIKEANEIHKNKYTYDKMVYINNKTSITITCPHHGEFEQQAYSHLTGCGCVKCILAQSSINLRKSIEQFIKESNEKHNNIYDYSKVVYINSRTKVVINCPIHGDFNQLPLHHINGTGCPSCAFKSEGTSRELCQELTGLSFVKIRPDFLKNPETSYNLELDSYCQAINMGVEYNDHAHKFYLNTDGQHLQQLRRDEIKKQLCDLNGTHLFYVPIKYNHRDRPAMKEFIRQKFIEIGCEHHLLPTYQRPKTIKINLISNLLSQ
jgi:hypothetical protein